MLELIWLDFPKFALSLKRYSPVWKSVEDLFSFLAQSHLEAVRESTGEGVWSSDHCREAGGVRSLSAGPQTDYSPFSPIWTGRGRFCTLFPNEARRKLRLLWNISDGVDHMRRSKPVRSGIYTPFTFCCAFWNGLWNYARFSCASSGCCSIIFEPFPSQSRRFDYRLSASGAGIMFLR